MTTALLLGTALVASGTAAADSLASYDKAASNWWFDQVRANYPDLKLVVHDDDVLVVHGPSGLPVNVVSPVVAASAVIHVIVLEPVDLPLSVEISNEGGHLTKQFWTGREEAQKGDAPAVERPRDKPAFVPRYVAALSGCSGTCTYTLTIKGLGGAEQKDNKPSFSFTASQTRDHFALSAGFGYDFARSTDYFVGTDGRPLTVGYTGPSLLLTGRWDVMCWANGGRCLGPFLGVRVSSPLNNFTAGAAFFFARRLSLQAGLSIHKAASFIGETRSIRRAWNGDRMGLVVAVSIDVVQFGRW